MTSLAPLPLFWEDLDTPLGTLLIVSDARERLHAVEWEEHRARMTRLLARYHGPAVTVAVRGTGRSPAANALDAYFAGELDVLERLDVALGGTPFQRAVWGALRTIPVGHTWSYTALAMTIGAPRSVRAVGLANGANPVGIVVPCHRVVGRQGHLTGYAGGLARKQWLLEHESRTRVTRLPLAAAVGR